MMSRQRITTMIQRLTGQAQDWAVAVCHAGGALTADYLAFLQEFKEVFDHPDQGQSSTQKLLHLHQGSSLVADYSIQFHILAADSG